MKALSIWQPWASLIISGQKKIETRSWPAPYSIRGQRIAIASTKTVSGEQRRAAAEDAFLLHYDATGLPEMEDLPMGCVLGTVLFEGCRAIDSEFLLELDEQEDAFGWYGPGRFAWFLKEPEKLDSPVAVRGRQGLWNSSPVSV
jgi:hypothetical protein